jgi:hypothetical protein
VTISMTEEIERLDELDLVIEGPASGVVVLSS